MKYGIGAAIACIVLYGITMEGVRFAAREIVGTFGIMGAVITIAAMYGAAVWYERRKERSKIEIIPPTIGPSPR